jgi:hypothetical protein
VLPIPKVLVSLMMPALQVLLLLLLLLGEELLVPICEGLLLLLLGLLLPGLPWRLPRPVARVDNCCRLGLLEWPFITMSTAL